MKKGIFVTMLIILLGLATYVFIAQKFSTRKTDQPAPQAESAPPAQTPPAPAFDTNDNLDQALLDLDQVE